MNGGDVLFHRLWGASFAGHLVLFAIFFLLPAGGPGGERAVPVYQVKIVDLPARPVAPQLDFSKESVFAPEADEPAAEDSPGAPLAVPSAALPAPARPPAPPRASAPAAPPPASVPSARLTAPAPPAMSQGVQPGAETTAPAPLPSLPSAPAPAPAPPAPLPVVPPPPGASPATPRSGSSLLERTRERVQTLQLRFEEAAVGGESTASPGIRGQAAPAASSRLSLRLYQNQLREEIQRRYHFPGHFDRDLRVRVRITVNRDGTVAKTEVLETSGHEPFDLAVRLTLRRAKFPPIPANIPGDTVVQVVAFSPDLLGGAQ